MNKLQNINCRLQFLVVVMLLIASNLAAQPQRDQRPPMPPDSSRIVQMVDELASAISLTEEQKAQVSKLHFAHFDEARKLMQENNGNREKHRKAMDKLRQDFEKQVKALLSDKQKTKFDEFMKKRGPRSGQQRPRR